MTHGAGQEPGRPLPHWVDDMGQHALSRTFWMSMPEESRHLARMQATWTLVRETVQQQQGMLLSLRDEILAGVAQ